MPTTHADHMKLNNAVVRNNVEEVQKILRNFDAIETTQYGFTSCLMRSCGHSSSPEILKLLFEKISETGGEDLLKSNLVKTNHDGWNCLMFGCRYSPSPEIIKLLFEKVVEVGGENFLETQLEATDNYGWTCLSQSCYNSAFPGIATLVFQKIGEVGGTEMLKSQLAATDCRGATCLMLACGKNGSIRVAKLTFEKIMEAGGAALLKSQLAAKDKYNGQTCLMRVCGDASSPSIMNLVWGKIIEVGGTDLLKSQLAATDDSGKNCFTLCCSYSKSSEFTQLLVKNIFPLGRRFLRDQTQPRVLKYVLSRSLLSAEVEILSFFAGLYSITGVFKDQYSRLGDEERKNLRRLCNIESGEWSRDSTMRDAIGDIKKSIKREEEEESDFSTL